jgi:hypothetical protein
MRFRQVVKKPGNDGRTRYFTVKFESYFGFNLQLRDSERNEKYMRVNIFLYILIGLLVFSCPITAQDNSTELRNAQTNQQKENFLKDSAMLKKDTLKKAVPAAAADSNAPTPSHLELNVVYESNDVNNGRKDSSVIPLITPKISYIFKSGFEIDLDVGYNIADPSPQVNQYTLDGSYTFNPGNYSGTVTLSAFWYNKSSGSVTAEQKGSLEYSNSYTLPFIQPSLSFTWTWGSTVPDYQLSPALQQQFNFGNNWNATPTLTMNAATQNSYNAYYQNRKFKIHRNGKPPLPANVSLAGEVLNADKFQVLDWEWSAPVNFTAGNWTFNFTPTYAMPVNPADIKATLNVNNVAKSYTYKEKLPNTFYVQVGVTYDFL